MNAIPEAVREPVEPRINNVKKKHFMPLGVS